MTALVDAYQRRIEYVRLSVTDRCDLRCSYCLPKGFRDFDEPDNWLTFEEIEQIMAAFAGLGVRRVRITGGEPLVRKGVEQLAGRLSRLGIPDLSLSTNGVRLDRLSRALRDNGVGRLNVSLDSLRPERFAEITGGGKLERVLRGLQVARETGFRPIKINTVAMKGVNDDEFDALLEYCAENQFEWRLIETMPMGATGRDAQDHYLDLQTVRADLARRYPMAPIAVSTGGGPARYQRVLGTDLKVGFITPMSQHFCETCNRVRLSVDGQLYLCLGQEHRLDLRSVVRAGATVDEIQAVLREGILQKPERHEFREAPLKIMRFMSKTGG